MQVSCAVKVDAFCRCYVCIQAMNKKLGSTREGCSAESECTQ